MISVEVRQEHDNIIVTFSGPTWLIEINEADQFGYSVWRRLLTEYKYSAWFGRKATYICITNHDQSLHIATGHWDTESSKSSGRIIIAVRINDCIDAFLEAERILKTTLGCPAIKH